MKKSLMLVAIGMLVTLAVGSNPSTATAAEFTGDCNVATCIGTIESTGITTFTDDSGFLSGKISCTKTTGTTTQTDNSSTGAATLVFTGCEEEFFNTQCNSTGVAGEIKTNVLTSHLLTLEKNPVVVGTLLTGVNVTISCPVIAVKKTVTGNVIGEIENPNCGVFATHHTVAFTVNVANNQKWTQNTTAGTVFDLISGSHAGDTTTSALVGTGHIKYNPGQSLALTC